MCATTRGASPAVFKVISMKSSALLSDINRTLLDGVNTVNE
jgi:hypothetical protein